MMKKTFLVALAVCCFVAAMAGVAFAQGYGGPAGGYLSPTVNPHGGFTTTTKNCGVCHSVHHALAGGEALMRGSIANACTFCHITTNTGVIQLYDYATLGNDSAYVGPSDYAHDTNGGVLNGGAGNGGVTCTNCHQVHAASNDMVTANAHLVTKILKTGTFQAGMPAIGGLDANGVAVSKWCTRCHPYYNEHFDGTSHVMRANGNTYSADRVADGKSAAGVAGAVAFATSRECHSCHNRGPVDQVEAAGPIGTPIPAVAYSFPHYSDGKRWLNTATGVEGAGNGIVGGANNPLDGTDTTDMDGACFWCHRDANGVGVGKNW